MAALTSALVSPLGAPFSTNAKKPFDQLTGSDVTMVRNPSTGKFDIQWDETGNVDFDDSEAHAVLSVLYERKGQYWADATGQRGSFLYAVKEDRKVTPYAMQGYAEDAMSLLVDQGKISPPPGQSKVQVSTTRVKPGRIDINVTY